MRTLIMSIVMLFIASSMSFAQTTKSADKKAKVTFIELGSIKCIPCKKMEFVLDDIRKEYPKDVKVIFYDVWTEAGKPFAKQYGVSAIPTQVFLDENGKEYFRHVGYFPKEEVVKILKKKDVKK